MENAAPIFDAEQGRALVGGLHLDPTVRTHLTRLEAQGSTDTLRRFAIACAERVAHAAHESAQKLLAAAHSDSDDARLAVRDELRGGAMAATTIGLRWGHASAAALLTAYEAAGLDAALAARGAARMEMLYDTLGGASTDGGNTNTAVDAQLAWLSDATG